MMSGASKRQAAQAHETKSLAIILPTIILPTIILPTIILPTIILPNAYFLSAKPRWWVGVAVAP